MTEAWRSPTFFETPEALRDWLDANHATADELFVGSWKKAVGKGLTWEEIVDEALAVGWIDGIRRSLPDDAWVIRLTPRRARSIWSNRNIERIAVLRAEGRLRPAGEAAFAARREDRSGVYSFEQRAEARLSEEQERRFQATPAAWTWFSGQAPSYRRAAIFWVVSAKREETRARRLRQLIEAASEGRDVAPIARPGRPTDG